jgi:hypothetical protein
VLAVFRVSSLIDRRLDLTKSPLHILSEDIKLIAK